MLIFDLFSISELLLFDTRTLTQYIDRFYGIMHWTDDKKNQMARELLQECYHGTTIEAELTELLGLHCQIKNDSLIKQLMLPNKTIKMY
jgi:hypothetical protein